jgi:hypothetical protein
VLEAGDALVNRVPLGIPVLVNTAFVGSPTHGMQVHYARVLGLPQLGGVTHLHELGATAGVCSS